MKGKQTEEERVVEMITILKKNQPNTIIVLHIGFSIYKSFITPQKMVSSSTFIGRMEYLLLSSHNLSFMTDISWGQGLTLFLKSLLW